MTKRRRNTQYSFLGSGKDPDGFELKFIDKTIGKLSLNYLDE